MYRNIPMAERLDKIGELLAKGVYLHMKKEKLVINRDREERKEIIQSRSKSYRRR